MEIESVMPGILNSCSDIQREKTTKFLVEYILVPKLSPLAYLSFLLVFLLNYFNIKQRTLLLICDAGPVTHKNLH